MVRSSPSESCRGRSRAPPAFVGCISGLDSNSRDGSLRAPRTLEERRRSRHRWPRPTGSCTTRRRYPSRPRRGRLLPTAPSERNHPVPRHPTEHQRRRSLRLRDQGPPAAERQPVRQSHRAARREQSARNLTQLLPRRPAIRGAPRLRVHRLLVQRVSDPAHRERHPAQLDHRGLAEVRSISNMSRRMAPSLRSRTHAQGVPR